MKALKSQLAKDVVKSLGRIPMKLFEFNGKLYRAVFVNKAG